MKLLEKITCGYLLLSIVLGPMLALIRPHAHPSGLDCEDSSWYIDGQTPPTHAMREAIYRHETWHIVPIASFLSAIGFILLGLVLYYGLKQRKWLYTLLFVWPLLVILAGYALLIMVFGSGFCGS